MQLISLSVTEKISFLIAAETTFVLHYQLLKTPLTEQLNWCLEHLRLNSRFPGPHSRVHQACYKMWVRCLAFCMIWVHESRVYNIHKASLVRKHSYNSLKCSIWDISASHS